MCAGVVRQRGFLRPCAGGAARVNQQEAHAGLRDGYEPPPGMRAAVCECAVLQRRPRGRFFFCATLWSVRRHVDCWLKRL